MFLQMEEWGKLKPYFPTSIVNIQYPFLSIFRITSLSRWNGAGRGLVRGGNRGWVASFFSAFLFGNFSFFFCVSSDSLGFQFVSFSQFLCDRGKWQWFSPFFTSSYLRICYQIRSPPTKRYKPGLVISLYQDAQCSKFTHNHHNKVKQGGCVSAEKHKSVHSYYIWIIFGTLLPVNSFLWVWKFVWKFLPKVTPDCSDSFWSHIPATTIYWVHLIQS